MIKLNKISTKPPKNADKKALKEATKSYAKRLGELQAVLRAEGKHSVLVIFQGMDASGKDGAVKNVFKYCLHDGVSVHSFKKPTNEEFAHDFIWRVHKQCPAKGQVQIFNRSHYEDILVQRVHGWIPESRVEKRMAAINAFEDLLQFDNNTVVLKFFLHLSKDQQKLELEERLHEPDKFWKHNDGDWEERKYWDKYQQCYEYVLNESAIPWTIVPVDDRWYRDYVVSKAIVEALEELDMEYPIMEE
ncbi:MAG: PPK2 family polyphosphate:nucleotide phosphotransferase [Paraglaciecola sp.]|jgi:PPK2 family polyphosphate:nucleotide phosphotransferase